MGGIKHVICFLFITKVWQECRAVPVKETSLTISNKLVFNQLDLAPQIKLQTLERSNHGSKDVMTKENAGGTLECSTCRTLLKLAMWKFRTPNYTYPGLPEFVDGTCKRLHIEENAVCDGLINVFKTEILTLLTKLRLNAEDVCGLILPTTCYSPTLSWNKVKWNISLPERKLVNRMNKYMKEIQGENIRVLQITDPHIDKNYKPGGIVNCDEPLCCHADSKVTKKASSKIEAGYWGSLGSCDTPFWTFESLLQFASKQEKYDYILWTGDLPAHNDWNQTRSNQIEVLKNMTATMMKYFPKTPIFPALGNHESNPVNSFPPNYVKGDQSISWLYTALRDAWSNWLPKSALETVEKYGYYTALVNKNFRIVSLNMNYCNQQNWWMLINPVDPDNELKWLVSVLQEAEDKGEHVHIIGHIPPGYGPDCLKIWSENYYTIINRYYDTITAQFFGHTHLDEFELFYDEATYSNPINIAYVGPSVTTYFNMNPAYRVYSVDDSNYNVVDFETYLLNLTEVNKRPNQTPTWELEYSARKEYNLIDLSPSSWNKLLNNWIEDPSSESFQKYYKFLYKGNPPYKDCNGKCRHDLLCSIKSGKSSDEDELCKNL